MLFVFSNVYFFKFDLFHFNTTTTKMSTHTPIVMALEGNIGAGKSYFCQTLQQQYNVPCFTESVLPELLQLFYTDPTTYAFTLQVHVLTKRLAIIENLKYRRDLFNQQQSLLKPPIEPVLWDRSLLGDSIFALVNANSGNIRPSEYAAYKTMCGFYPLDATSLMNSKYLQHIDVFVLLWVDPTTCKQQTLLRGNESEKNIDLGYYRRLQSTHFEVFVRLLQLPWLRLVEQKCNTFLGPVAMIRPWNPEQREEVGAVYDSMVNLVQRYRAGELYPPLVIVMPSIAVLQCHDSSSLSVNDGFLLTSTPVSKSEMMAVNQWLIDNNHLMMNLAMKTWRYFKLSKEGYACPTFQESFVSAIQHGENCFIVEN